MDEQRMAADLKLIGELVAQGVGMEPEGGAVTENAVDFMDEVMTQISQAQSDSRRIYEFLQENLTRLNPDFLAALPVAFQQLKVRNSPELIAKLFVEFGNLIQKFPLGKRWLNLELSLAAYQQSIDFYSKDEFPRQWAVIHNNLAAVYIDRVQGDPAQNLEEAIKACNSALMVYNNDFPEQWANIKNNLATAYMARIQGDPAENLKQAIINYEEALQVCTSDSFPTLWATVKNNQARAYRDLLPEDIAIREETPECWILLFKAIDFCEEVIEVCEAKALPSEYRVTAQANLARIYLLQGEAGIEKAIAVYEQISEFYTKDTTPEQWAGIQHNLASAYNQRVQGNPADNRKQAIIYSKKALEIFTCETFPQNCRNTSRGLGNLQIKLQNWKAAADAYTLALDAAELLYRNCLLLDSRDAELKESAHFHHLAAYTYTKNGKLDKAINTLERGRARGLSETFNRDRADLQKLQQQRPDLYTTYQDITNQLRNLESLQRDRSISPERNELTPEAHRITAQRLNQELTETISQIRQVPGYEKFLQTPEFSTLQTQLQPDNPLVYLITTPNGSLALIAAPDRLEQLWLDDFNETQLTGLLNDHWLKTYRESRTDRQSWLDTIETVTCQLWEPLMSPLIDRLKQTGNTRATLIPTGYLSLLPLHAAWTKDTTKPIGKRYALDEIHFTYAPNAQSLIAARAIADRHTNPDSILAIDNPLGDLRYSTREVNSAIAHFTHDEVLPYDRATVANVAAQLGDAAVVHFSCHGSAITTEPLNSHLQLHTTEIDNAEALEAAQLKLVKIFELNLSDRGGIRLAILSACETGLTGIELADEAIGLPTGLMQAGVAGVIASLWKVDDLSTSLLMQKFYDLWRKDKLEPSEALRRAQIWLRDSTNAEKNKEGAGLRRVQPNTQDFKHPFHWAAFSYLGI